MVLQLLCWCLLGARVPFCLRLLLSLFAFIFGFSFLCSKKKEEKRRARSLSRKHDLT